MSRKNRSDIKPALGDVYDAGLEFIEEKNYEETQTKLDPKFRYAHIVRNKRDLSRKLTRDHLNINTTALVDKLPINTYADSNWGGNAGVFFQDYLLFLGFFPTDVASVAYPNFDDNGLISPEIMMDMAQWVKMKGAAARSRMKFSTDSAYDKLIEISQRRVDARVDHATTKYYDVDGNIITTESRRKYSKRDRYHDGSSMPKDRMRHNETHIRANSLSVEGIFCTKADWEKYDSYNIADEMEKLRNGLQILKANTQTSYIKSKLNFYILYYRKSISLLTKLAEKYSDDIEKLDSGLDIDNKELRNAFYRKKSKNRKFDDINVENKIIWLRKNIGNIREDIFCIKTMIYQLQENLLEENINRRLERPLKFYVTDASRGQIEEVELSDVQAKNVKPQRLVVVWHKVRNKIDLPLSLHLAGYIWGVSSQMLFFNDFSSAISSYEAGTKNTANILFFVLAPRIGILGGDIVKNFAINHVKKSHENFADAIGYCMDNNLTSQDIRKLFPHIVFLGSAFASILFLMPAATNLIDDISSVGVIGATVVGSLATVTSSVMASEGVVCANTEITRLYRKGRDIIHNIGSLSEDDLKYVGHIGLLSSAVLAGFTLVFPIITNEVANLELGTASEVAVNTLGAATMVKSTDLVTRVAKNTIRITWEIGKQITGAMGKYYSFCKSWCSSLSTTVQMANCNLSNDETIEPEALLKVVTINDGEFNIDNPDIEPSEPSKSSSINKNKARSSIIPISAEKLSNSGRDNTLRQGGV